MRTWQRTFPRRQTGARPKDGSHHKAPWPRQPRDQPGQRDTEKSAHQQSHRQTNDRRPGKCRKGPGLGNCAASAGIGRLFRFGTHELYRVCRDVGLFEVLDETPGHVEVDHSSENGALSISDKSARPSSGTSRGSVHTHGRNLYPRHSATKRQFRWRGLWIVVIGVIVWLGPRPSQWRAKQRERDHEAERPDDSR